MDFHLKKWRDQNESDQQPPPSAKMPKLLLNHPHQLQPAIPLFAPHHHDSSHPNNKPTHLSASFSDSSSPATTSRFPRMGCYFSLAQWQELELQALIYRYMLAGAAVPPELLQQIKKSFLHSPQYFLQHYPFYQHPPWYWGRGAMDPEPGRCRRTDGKKWRCSRDVVAGQKYCERHVHRGRNRSRKPVEIPTPSAATPTIGGESCGTTITASPLASISNGTITATTTNPLSKQSLSIDLFCLNHSSSDSKTEKRGLLGPPNEVANRSDGHILRHFFNDWPGSLQGPDNTGSNASPMSSATCLSISMSGNSSSDVSLKLSTGNGENTVPRVDERDQSQLNWGTGWGSNPVASMGGPLAEALRSSSSSISNSSPTSVLHQLPRGPTSEATSFVST